MFFLRAPRHTVSRLASLIDFFSTPHNLNQPHNPLKLTQIQKRHNSEELKGKPQYQDFYSYNIVSTCISMYISFHGYFW